MRSHEYIKHVLCSSRKNPYPPHGRSSEIPRGRGDLNVKILEAKYEAKLAFPGGMGDARQKPSMGVYSRGSLKTIQGSMG